MLQLHIYYSGKVQGVGFRYTVRDMAVELGVTGWVRNLPDRRVEVVAQAQEEVLTKFLQEIGSEFSRHIKDVAIDREEALVEYRGFDIKH